jgi:hypothetical protein
VIVIVVVVGEEEAETGGVQAEAADASVVGEKGWWILDVHYSEVQEELFVTDSDSGAVAQREARGEKERIYGRGWAWEWLVGEHWQRRPC